jgi:hypothetical protein
MSAYINLNSLFYPLYEGDIRLEYPEILESQTGDSFPIPENYAKVVWVEPPKVDYTLYTCYEGQPENINSQWQMTWLVRELTAEEIQNNNAAPFPELSQNGSAPDVIE